MNSLVLLIGGIAVLLSGYALYRKVMTRLFGVDDALSTPAHTCGDGCDFVPVRHWTVLFGHHFSSIAGAGPVIGPVLAAVVWGWFPSMLWIVLGSVFIGGVHDFGSLMVSVRNRGSSVADVADKLISRRAKIIFGLFLWFALILVDAVFVIFAAKTFVAEPGVVLPAFGLMPVAVAVGYFLYVKKSNQVLVTAGGLACLLVLIILSPAVTGTLSMAWWSIILLAYCYIASVTPVNILLQPRDYLSSYLLIFGILFGVIGIAVSHPAVALPAVSVPRPAQPLWPMLFVTIACGAVSGFHSLIASGTTSKQLDREKHAFKIGYGAMIVEGVLAVMALLVVAGGLSAADAGRFIADGNPIGAFGAGYGNLTSSFMGSYGTVFALMVLNAFILTTLDTSTRITRYLTEELFGLKNRFLSTLLVVILAGWMALSGEGDRIWPVFGASNQLVGALTLIVISAWLLQKGRNAGYTLWPMFFMLVTTVGALVFQAAGFLKEGRYFLGGISIALVVMALFLVVETVAVFRRKKASENNDLLPVQSGNR